jgi:hypothetical protein
MPSIFIWKSETPNTSTKKIKYHSGSNWIIEDTEYSSKSYIYLEQIVIPGFDNSVITFHIKQMPINWVGSELLNILELPYKHIKTDEYGTLEMIGDWMRFTLKNEIDYNSNTLLSELTKIKQWINNDNNTNTNTNNNNKNTKKSFRSNKEIIPTIDNIQHNFQNFLIKYTM